MSENASLKAWVDQVAAKTKPDRVVWCNGSEEEYRSLVEGMLSKGTLHGLNEGEYPGCYLHRSDPNDVARTEHLTFICCEKQEDAGPTNNWMAPDEARDKVGKLFEGAMKGRTLYVVPYLMGPPGSPISEVGVELTDSPYVVVNMRIMTRMGDVALEQLGDSGKFVKGLHSVGDLSPERRFILHFPQDMEIWSIGSGYGGNALLGKKCFALRLASTMARRDGWMAEHMLILGIENPRGETKYVAAAFPSACGKTNLAMLVPPEVFRSKGYKVWTVGDDIAWLRFDKEGRLRAINPEAGFFGVVPGTNSSTNPNAVATCRSNTIYTNVAVSEDGMPWWEGCDGESPSRLTDWRGDEWTPSSGKPAAHPNSRFTAPARQCPSISPRWEDPEGVPISAFIFGGRRARVAPLVFEALSWEHGVYVGAGMASETTAAASGAVGKVRRDPMAMIPFCGYNMGDYFSHWLEMGRKSDRVPKIFHVNWFRTGKTGEFLWPGFGENLRVLLWILSRCEGEGKAEETAIGHVPGPGGLDLEGLNISPDVVQDLLDVDRDAWLEELDSQTEFFVKFGDRLPSAVRQELEATRRRLRS